ncbi:MAG: nicotinamide-nucleotide amidohydrolase family protein [Sideroxydans sp.]|nr:nicotinamide-nucleotide amidohydrolase family protein [Sideroxydans sp.]
MDTLAAQVGEVLKAHGMMLVTAESCTGGGVAQAVTDIAGSSAWFERGFVTYANQAKVEMLGVRQSTLDSHGAVSEMTVREMVMGAMAHSHAHIAVAVSGIAGPGGGTVEKPVGTVWFAWALRDGQVLALCHLLAGNRAAVREQSVSIALQGILEVLNRQSASA